MPNTKSDDALSKRGSATSAALLTYGTNLSVSVLSLANVLIVSRVLGPGARGEVAFLITVATMSAQIGGLSVQEANANIGGSEPQARARLATSCSRRARLRDRDRGDPGWSVAAFPAVGGPVTRGLLWVAVASIPVVIARVYFSFLLQSEYAFKVTNLAWLIGPLIGALGNAALALLGWITVTTAFATWVIGQVIGLVLMVVYAARHNGFARPDLALVRRALGFGLKTHPGRLMGVGNYRADQWFVGSIAGARELGFYSVAVAWAEMLYYLPGVLTLVQRPDLVRATRDEAARLTARVFRIAMILATSAAVALILVAPLLCTVVFGSEFSASVDDLRVLALGAFGITAIDLLPNALTAQRMPIRGMWAIAVAFVRADARARHRADPAVRRHRRRDRDRRRLYGRRGRSGVDLQPHAPLPRPRPRTDARRAPLVLEQAPGSAGTRLKISRCGWASTPIFSSLRRRADLDAPGVHQVRDVAAPGQPARRRAVSTRSRAEPLPAPQRGALRPASALRARDVGHRPAAGPPAHARRLRGGARPARRGLDLRPASGRGRPRADGTPPRDAARARRDYPLYIGSRLPSRKWAWAVAAAHALEATFRRLARTAPTVAVGDDLAQKYARSGGPVLATGFSLIGGDEIVSLDEALARDWSGDLSILSVGRLDQEKNPLLLPDVLAALRRADPRCRPTIAGDGPLAGAVEGAPAALGIRDAVRVRGVRAAGACAAGAVPEPSRLPPRLADGGFPAGAVRGAGRGNAGRGRRPWVAFPRWVRRHDSALLLPPSDAPAAAAAVTRIEADVVLRRDPHPGARPRLRPRADDGGPARPDRRVLRVDASEAATGIAAVELEASAVRFLTPRAG